nr:hypothetical protein [uncultured Brevundimonas sp.]
MSHMKIFNRLYMSLPGLLIAMIALSGCARFEPVSVVADAGVPDGPWMPLHVPDDLPAPRESVTISGQALHRYDTDLQSFVSGGTSPTNPIRTTITQEDNTELLVWSVLELRVEENAALRVEGSRPLLIVAKELVDIKGNIDASSTKNYSQVGAGANRPGCAEAQLGDDDGGGGAGSGGGGFQGTGGSGGDGDADDSNGDGQAPGGAGGAPQGVPEIISGGCPGTIGASNISIQGGPGGLGGDGGGAIEIVSYISIAISGELDSCGEGGRGALPFGGAGGGGSGGYIGLDAPLITLDAKAILAANGGGGGEGGGTSNAGSDGQDGYPGSDPAFGGGGSADFGADGGNGSSLESLDGESVTQLANVGGGGGGGGAGYILVRTRDLVDNGATVSPPRTDIPE